MKTTRGLVGLATFVVVNSVEDDADVRTVFGTDVWGVVGPAFMCSGVRAGSSSLNFGEYHNCTERETMKFYSDLMNSVSITAISSLFIPDFFIGFLTFSHLEMNYKC